MRSSGKRLLSGLIAAVMVISLLAGHLSMTDASEKGTASRSGESSASSQDSNVRLSDGIGQGLSGWESMSADPEGGNAFSVAEEDSSEQRSGAGGSGSGISASGSSSANASESGAGGFGSGASASGGSSANASESGAGGSAQGGSVSGSSSAASTESCGGSSGSGSSGGDPNSGSSLTDSSESGAGSSGSGSSDGDPNSGSSLTNSSESGAGSSGSGSSGGDPNSGSSLTDSSESGAGSSGSGSSGGHPNSGSSLTDSSESGAGASDSGSSVSDPNSGSSLTDSSESGAGSSGSGSSVSDPDSGSSLTDSSKSGGGASAPDNSGSSSTSAGPEGTAKEGSEGDPGQILAGVEITEEKRKDICREIDALTAEEETETVSFFAGPCIRVEPEVFLEKLAGSAQGAGSGEGNVTWIRTAGYDTSMGAGGAVGYNGWGTHAFLVQDSDGGWGKVYPAICMSPNLDAPANGQTYTRENAEIFTNTDPILLKILYYGFGGPGKDWAQQVYFNRHGSWSRDASLIITHTAVSKAFARIYKDRYDATGSLWDYCLGGTSYIQDTETFLATLNGLSAPPAGTFAQILWVGGRTQFLVYLKQGPTSGRLSVHKYTDDQQMFEDGDYDLSSSFDIFDASNNQRVQTIATDKNGNSGTVTLNAGTYYLRETKAGSHMILPEFHYDASDNIRILNNDVTVDAANEPYGHCRVVIRKVTEFGKVLTDESGVEFTLSVWDGSRYVEREKLAYDSVLKRFCSSLIYADAANPTGKFKVEETKMPTDYDYLPEGEEPFSATGMVGEALWSASARKKKGKTWGYIWAETVENRHEYSLMLQKIDRKTGESLKGAEFTVYALVGEDRKKQKLGVMKYDKNAVYEGKRGLYVYGKDSRDAEAGEKPVLITAKNGGAFYVEETSLPENYGGPAALSGEKFSKSFELSEKTPVDEPYMINPKKAAGNTPDPSYGIITVTKKDPKGKPLTGARFLVREYDASEGDYVRGSFQYYTKDSEGELTENTVKTYYLTDNGDGTYTSDYLPVLAGDNAAKIYGRCNEGRYKVTEVSPPEGYVSTADRTVNEVTERWFREVQFSTTLDSNKADRWSASYTAINPENLIPLKKVAADGETALMAEFTIWPEDEELSGKSFVSRTTDGSGNFTVETARVLSANGTAIWTGRDGLLQLARLPVGRYRIRETGVSSEWYQPLDKTFRHTVYENGSVDGRTAADTDLVRNRPGPKLIITKADTLPEEGDVETEFPKGTKFAVYPFLQGSGRYSKTPQAVLVWKDGDFVSEKTGEAVRLFWKESNGGKFQVKEIAQTPGYIRDTEAKYVAVPQVPSEEDEAVIRVSFENEPNRITIRKEDEEGTRLSGAVFSLQRKNGDDPERDFRTLVTDQNGEASAFRLAPGVWTYQETAAPAGFHLDEAARGEFTVDEDGRVDPDPAVFTVLNYPEIETVIQKKDAATGAQLDPATGFPSGTTFDVYEWDEELSDYKSSPIMHIEYIDDYYARQGSQDSGIVRSIRRTVSEESSGETAFEAAGGAGAWTLAAASPEGFIEEEEDGIYAKETVAGAGTYSLRYELGGGSLSGKPSSAAVGEIFTLNVPAKEGKAFMGWKITGMTEGQTHYYGRRATAWGNTTSAASIAQTGSTQFKNLAEAGGTVTFTAIWADPVKYSIRYELGGGSWDSGYEPTQEAWNGFGLAGSVYDAYVQASSLYLTPPNDLLEFDGWRITGLSATVHSKKAAGTEWSGSSAVDKTGSMMFYNLNHKGGRVTFTAIWKPLGYPVSYDYAGGTGDDENPVNVSLGETFTVSRPCREGYDFAGWSITGLSRDAAWTWWAADGTSVSGTGVSSLTKVPGVSFKDLRTDGYETVSFKAVWERYTVSYRLNGGSWPAGAQIPQTYVSSGSVQVPIPERVGYLFAGWEELGTTDAILGNGQTGNLTLTALWRNEGIWVDSRDGGAPVVAKTEKNQGKFKIVERTATSGYMRDKAPQYLDIGDETQVEDHRAVFTFVNEPNEYRFLKVNKEGVRINGAVFRVWSDDAKDAERIAGDYVTGVFGEEEGVIVLRRIPSGTWHAREISAPSPYLASSLLEYTFVVDGDGYVDSARKYQEIQEPEGPCLYIQKVTEEGKPLLGAWFEITREENGNLANKKTNSSGTILLENLSDGTYSVRESPTRNDSLIRLGYIIPDTVWRFRVSGGNTITPLTEGITVENADGVTIASLTAVNRRKKLTIRKKDDLGSALEGAEFLLTNPGTGETRSAVTGSDGSVTIKDAFSEGVWTVRETKAPDGPLVYRLDEHEETFTVENGLFGGTDTELSLEFINVPYSFEIRKADVGGQPLAGVTFRIWSEDGYERTVATALTRDENGNTVASALADRLTSGLYHVEETKTLDGYRLDSRTKDVRVTENGPDPGVVTFVNEPLKMQVRKVDEEGNPLAGALFELWYMGTAEEPANAKAGEQRSGEDGCLTFGLPGLARGSYELRETEAPEGWDILRAPILIAYDGEKAEVTASGAEDIFYDEKTWTLTVTDHREKKGSVRVRKVDSVSGEVLEGALFEVRERVGTGEDGEAVYASPGQELVWDPEERWYVSETELPITSANGGEYLIVETKAPEGYIGSFQETVLLSEDETRGIEILAPNEPNSFEIWKENDRGEKLKEAWFRVWQEGVGTEEETEALQTTGGILRLERLAAGTWHFREVPPYPEGFEGSDELHTFRVLEDGRIEGEDHIVVINRKKVDRYGLIRIRKSDEEGEPMEGVVLRAWPFDAERGLFPEKRWLAEHRAETGLTEPEEKELIEGAEVFEFVWDEEEKRYQTGQLLPLTDENDWRFLVAEEGFSESPEGLAHEGYAAGLRAEVSLNPTENPKVTDLEFSLLALEIMSADEVFVNHPNELVIGKTNEKGEPLAGAVLRVVSDEGKERFPETDLVTGADGRTEPLRMLPQGSYTLSEIAAPRGHILHSDEKWHFLVDERGLLAETDAEGTILDRDGDGVTEDEYAETLTIRIVNEANAVEVLKEDAGGRPIAGVEISFWDPAGELYAVRTTGAEGRTEPLAGLSEGTWTYRETKKNGQAYEDVDRHFMVSQLGLRVGYGDAPAPRLVLRITNGEKEGSVTVEKVDKENLERLHGAVFEVLAYDPEISDFDRETVVMTLAEEMDGEGEPTGIYKNPEPIQASSENDGRFLIRETKGPLDPVTGERIYAAIWEREIRIFEKEDWEFTVSSGDPAENSGTGFRIRKVDEEGRALDGAIFQIWPEGGEETAWKETTGADGETGTILLGGLDPDGATPLRAGTVWYYQEISPPPGGWILDSEIRSFKIAEDGTILGAAAGEAQVVNHPKFFSLMTGGPGRLSWVLAGLLGMLILGAAAICRGRRRYEG